MSGVSVRGPQPLDVNHIDAWLWVVDLGDGVPHLLAWSPVDGRLRLSWLLAHDSWSGFVALGPAYSPRHDLRDAHAAVELWAGDHARRDG